MAPKKKKRNSPNYISTTKCLSQRNEKTEVYSESLTPIELSLGFQLKDLTSFTRFCQLMHRPTDPSSLAVVRILFGLLMVIDTQEERGLSEADLKWGDPHSCHFPLFNFLKPLSIEWMCVLYMIMWFGALGLMLGVYFRLSCLCYVLPYWYILLLDKSSWNNHSYLYGLLSVMFLFSSAHHCWSVDGLLGRAPVYAHVPLWNYAVLRFQVFVLYFIAGLKKLDLDWLAGYSMSYLSSHWLFDPFKLTLTEEQIDYWIVHMFGFLLDLTIGFWMYFDRTRPMALLFLAAFHIMNSRIFSIGMFPYVCLATMPLYCHPDWPRKLKLFTLFKKTAQDRNKSNACVYLSKPGVANNSDLVNWRHKLTCICLLIHVALQGFLPYSHFLTKGYNNWTNGLYGYSWDMMVHSWDTVLVVVKVVDKDTGEEHFLDPDAWTHTERYSKHGDMMYQYAHCLRDNIRRENPKLQNISIHIDVWCSLNRRFQQRMFDPRVDLLTVDWSPFQPVSWLMPLLTEFSSWRQKISELEEQVYSWSNFTDVMFVADFPDLYLENYIHEELTNVTLTVLEGEVIVEVENGANTSLHEGEATPIPRETFHRVHTASASPSCYMYTYTNETLLNTGATQEKTRKRIQIQVWNEIRQRWWKFTRSVNFIGNSLYKIFYSFPMMKRFRIY